MPRYRIAIINQHVTDTLGGSEIQCDIIAHGLWERGHLISYLAIDGRTEGDYKTPYQVVPVARNADRIAEKVLELGSDIVYCALINIALREQYSRLKQRVFQSFFPSLIFGM